MKALSPFKVPISENAPLSDNVIDQRDKPSIEPFDYSADLYPTVGDNPLLEQIKNAIVQGRIRGAW